jgi:hypothetical protein
MIKKNIIVPIYGNKVIFLATDNVKNIPKYLDFSYDNVYAHTIIAYEKGEEIFIILNQKENLSVGVLAHEVIHAANFIFYSRGIKLDIENDEAYAYLVEYLMDKLSKFYKKVND